MVHGNNEARSVESCRYCRISRRGCNHTTAGLAMSFLRAHAASLIAYVRWRNWRAGPQMVYAIPSPLIASQRFTMRHVSRWSLVTLVRKCYSARIARLCDRKKQNGIGRSPQRQKLRTLWLSAPNYLRPGRQSRTRSLRRSTRY